MTPDHIDQFLHESALEMTADELEASHTLAAGQQIGSYRIEQLLGTGGMSEVYQACDTRPQLARRVAIKVLRPYSCDPRNLRERLERESQALASLSHPHICRIFDVCHQAGVDFIVMEYLEGETLAARLRRETLDAADALEIAIQIASALDAAHRAGIVHRDLKPGNVMLTNTGAKLLDFGLATTSAFRSRTKTSSFEVSEAAFGTLEHMAPEQLEGQSVDARADVFAFGIVLYEMLTRRKPFTGPSPARIIAAVLKDQPVAPSAVASVRSSALDRVVRKCLAKNPDERWQTAKDLCDELRWIAGTLPGRLRNAPSPEQQCLPHDGWIWAVGTVLLLAIALRWTLRAGLDKNTSARAVGLG
jgi:serine/threonine protein kinase